MGIPEKIMKNVTGEIVLAEVKAHVKKKNISLKNFRMFTIGYVAFFKVLPVKNFPIEAINDQSRRLIQVHLNNNIGRARILQQVIEIEQFCKQHCTSFKIQNLTLFLLYIKFFFNF